MIFSVFFVFRQVPYVVLRNGQNLLSCYYTVLYIWHLESDHLTNPSTNYWRKIPHTCNISTILTTNKSVLSSESFVQATIFAACEKQSTKLKFYYRGRWLIRISHPPSFDHVLPRQFSSGRWQGQVNYSGEARLLHEFMTTNNDLKTFFIDQKMSSSRLIRIYSPD